MACNKRKGLKTGLIPNDEIRNGNPNTAVLAKEDIILNYLQEINSIENGASSKEFTWAGFFESLAGSTSSGLLLHLFTKGEYKESIALLQKTMDLILLEMQKLNGNDKETLHVKTGIQIPPTPIQKMGMPMVKLPNKLMM